VVASFSSTDAPLGVLHLRCGNSRAADCTSCSSYSLTLGQLRRRRLRYQRALAAARREGRTRDVRDLDDLLDSDAEETTLVIGQWTYAGTGWETDGDTELAKAAARAREYVQERAAIKHQKG
jgi:hypothetical protein